MPLKETIEKYTAQSKQADNLAAGYSPLFCAVWDDANADLDLADLQLADLQLWMENIKARNAVSELEHIAAGTGETIFHVAMRHLEVFKLICTTLQDLKPETVETLFKTADKDGDFVGHQLVEFGRWGAYNYLMTELFKDKPDEVKVALLGLDSPNAYGETPLQIATKGDESETVKDLRARNIDLTAFTTAIKQFQGSFTKLAAAAKAAAPAASAAAAPADEVDTDDEENPGKGRDAGASGTSVGM